MRGCLDRTRMLAGLALAMAFAAPASASDLETMLSEVSEQVRPGVVSIEAVRRFGSDDGHCLGSGVIVEADRIVTTLYVAGPGDDIRVRYADGRTSSATVIAVDPMRELAVLRPDVRGGRPLTLGQADDLIAGSWIFVVGFSLNTPEATFDSGRFSSRTVFAPDDIELLQLEAHVYPGHSGGAVVNADGEVVGIVFGGLGNEGYLNPVVLSSFGEGKVFPNPVMVADRPLGIGFALPVDAVRAAVASARNAEIGVPYLGVRVNMTTLHGTPRVAIREVVPQSPAFLVGLRAGECIVAVDGDPIESDTALMERVRGMSPGDELRLSIDHPRGRAGGESARDVTVTLGDYTTDYRMRVIRQRLLAGRAANLRAARDRLLDHLGVLEGELEQVSAVTESISN